MLSTHCFFCVQIDGTLAQINSQQPPNINKIHLHLSFLQSFNFSMVLLECLGPILLHRNLINKKKIYQERSCCNRPTLHADILSLVSLHHTTFHKCHTSGHSPATGYILRSTIFGAHNLKIPNCTMESREVSHQLKHLIKIVQFSQKSV